MRIIARHFGRPEDVLFTDACPCPVPEPGGAVVRMLASPINPSDLVTLSGAYAHRTPLPFIPGFEGVGLVEAVGAEVAGLRPGQRVLPLGSAGCWQGFKALPADWCVPVPEDLAEDQAATAYVNPLTARLMLQAMAPAPGMLVAVNAAASAIGRMLLRLLHAAGARPLAIIRSAAARSMLADEPAAAILAEDAPLPPLDGGFDAVGGSAGAAMAAAIRPGGLFLHYGLLSGLPLPADLARRVPAVVRPFWLRGWVHAARRPELRQAMAAVFDDIRAGLAATAIAARYPLRDIHAALAHDARSRRGGKILLIP